MKNNMRFVQDDDCHWYLIPEECQEEFEEWVSTEDDWDKTDYEYFRCNPPSTYIVDIRE